MDDEFYYYNSIYENIKEFGLPYQNWLDAPPWVLQMYNFFKSVDNEFENYLMSRKYG